MVPLLGAAHAAPNKGTTILYRFRSPKTLLNPPVNGKIQGLFKAFECFSSTFQGKLSFQGLFKTVLYIQVLFKPVRTLSIALGVHYSFFFLLWSTFFGSAKDLFDMGDDKFDPVIGPVKQKEFSVKLRFSYPLV